MIEDFENFVQVDESFLIVLDSRNATEDNSTYGYNSDLTFKLQTPIIQPVNAINLKADVLNFTCPNSQYVINESNNVLGISFDTTGTPYTNTGYNALALSFFVPIPPSNYNAYTFIDVMVDVFTDLTDIFGFFGNFSIQYSPLTNRFTLINDTYYFFIDQNILFSSTFYPAIFKVDSGLLRIGDVMGFDNAKTYTSTPVSQSGNSYSAPFFIAMPFPVNFSGIQNINIHVENFKTFNVSYQAKNLILTKNKNTQEYDNNSRTNIACSIPVNCKPMEVIFYDKIGQFAFSVKDEQIDTIRITLRDDLGNLLQLNGQNWNLTLEFILTKHIEKKTRNFYSILANPYPRFE